MLALKQYELSNHLGNVLATVLDRKTMTSDKVLAYATNFTGTLDGWTAGWSAAGTIYGATPPTTIALDNNRVKCTSTVSMGGVRKVINTTIGTAYTITMDIDMGTSEGLYIMPRATNGANEFTGTNITQVYIGASGTYTVNFTATTSTTQLLVEKAGYVEKYFFIDNVKVEQSTPTLSSYFVADVVNAQYYYPFGSTMKTWRADGDDYRFGFNGKENDNETYGTGNALDFGARIYNSRLGKWLSVDPLQAEYPSQGSYNFSANSPILYVDRDGRKVFIYGKDAENTVCALQKTTSLQLSYDVKTNQLTATGEPQNDYDRELLAAINDPNVIVNLYVTDKIGYMPKDGTQALPIMVGAYDGSEVVGVDDKDQFLKDVASGDLKNATGQNYGQKQVETTQLFNYDQASLIEKNGGEEIGRAAGHEILESYYGGLYSPGGTWASSRDKAHTMALSVDPIAASSKDATYKDTSRGYASYQWKMGNGKTLEFSRSMDLKNSNNVFEKPKKEDKK